MRVLLRIRSDVERFPGGDYVQLQETRAALEKLGVACTVAPGVGQVEGQFDVVHLFNTTRIHETLLQFSAARALHQPVVLSPIWHSLADMRRFYGSIYHLPFFPIETYLGMKEFFYARRSQLPISLRASWLFGSLQRKLLSQCDAILPNSATELEVLTRESGVAPPAAFISPLGMQPIPTRPAHLPARRDVICAGRIEPRKNQLSVIRAFKRLPRDGRRLRLFGQKNSSHAAYSEKVLAECVPGWVEYGGTVAHSELMEIIQGCQVAVLMSFFETFGLAALEGLGCGTTLCLADTAYNRGIYGDRALYADPYSVGAISQCLATAFAWPEKNHQSFLDTYTWEKAAITTLAAYKHVAGV